MMIQTEFGKFVYEKRVGKAWSQAQLAEKADVDIRHIHNIEYGLVESGIRTVVVLADLLDIDLNTLKTFAVHDENCRYLKAYDATGTIHV